MKKLVVNEQFADLCRNLTGEEYNQLRENILENGCLDPIVVWNNTIIDGHNRYDICIEENIEFDTIELDFPDEDAAIVWVVNNQLGRRNLEPIDMVRLSEIRRPILEKQASERMKSGVGLSTSDPVVNLPQGPNAGRTRQKMGKIAGVSEKTYDNLRVVNEKGTGELKSAVRKKSVGASTAAKIAKLPKDQQNEELGKKIAEKGENVKTRKSTNWEEIQDTIMDIIISNPVPHVAAKKVVAYVKESVL